MSKLANLRVSKQPPFSQPKEAPVPVEPEPALNKEPSKSSEGTSAKAKSVSGRKSIGIMMRPAAHKQLKVMAAKQGRGIGEVLSDALNDYFKKFGEPEVG